MFASENTRTKRLLCDSFCYVPSFCVSLCLLLPLLASFAGFLLVYFNFHFPITSVVLSNRTVANLPKHSPYQTNLILFFTIPHAKFATRGCRRKRREQPSHQRRLELRVTFYQEKWQLLRKVNPSTPSGEPAMTSQTGSSERSVERLKYLPILVDVVFYAILHAYSKLSPLLFFLHGIGAVANLPKIPHECRYPHFVFRRAGFDFFVFLFVFCFYVYRAVRLIQLADR